jgi:light-regulated signal transduction histidine kinase (bacteriophytochrome)
MKGLPLIAPPSAETGAAPPDLTSCDREPIHQLGQVQSWGFLLSAGADETIYHASANVIDHFGLAAETIIGRKLETLLQPAALHDIRSRLQSLQGLQHTDRVFGVHLLAGRTAYDLALHYPPSDVPLFVLEAELSADEPSYDAIATVKGMMARLLGTPDLAALHARAARQVRSVLGFDRVMVYRFDTDGSGEVVAESAAVGLETFLGLRYPATDIPAQARAMYCRNWLRLIVDVAAPTVAILPLAVPGRQPLDLSSSVLRSISPVHVEYLRNMGVVASLSISIMRGGRLWGLLACHHSQPLLPGFQRRSAAELFGQMYSLVVESREREGTARYNIVARAVHDRLLASLSDDATQEQSLHRIAGQALSLVPCDGVAIHNAGRTEIIGAAPDATTLEGILDALRRSDTSRMFATTEIAQVYPPAATQVDVAAGMLAVPMSTTGRDYLIFFRREVVRTVTWAGDPNKPVEAGTVRMSPRRSFEAWRQTVRGQSAPWLEAELLAAEALRIAVLEVAVRQVSNAAAVMQREASERQGLLIDELNHRVRNVLALISALVSRSMGTATSLQTFVVALNGRIQALARAHNQLTEDRWGPVPLHSMIADEFQAYLGEGQTHRVLLSGPVVLVEPQAVTVLALVVHEMATNAVKYGALSNAGGIVDVVWRLEVDGSLTLTWQESGGPPVAPPTRSGFGSTVTESTIPFELQGRAAVNYAAEGVHAEFAVPARYVHLGVGDAAFAAAPARAPEVPQVAVRASGMAMVLEDQTLLAIDAQEILLDLGFDPVEVVGNARAALELLARINGKLTFALLDVNLGDHTSLPVAQELLRRGIPFAFATGYGQGLQLPAEMVGMAMIVQKPYRRQDIADLVQPTPGD